MDGQSFRGAGFPPLGTTGGQRQKIAPKRVILVTPRANGEDWEDPTYRSSLKWSLKADCLERKLLPTLWHGQQEGFVLTLLVATLQAVQGMGLCPWVALGSPRSLSATLEKQQKGLGKEEE